MNHLTREFRVFLSCPRPMKVLLAADLIFAFVMPVIGIFAAACARRSTLAPARQTTRPRSFHHPMRRLAWFTFAVLTLVCSTDAWGSTGRTAVGALEAGFASPPRQARLQCFWWWLNGNVTRESITRDLEEMKAKGYGGAEVFDAGGADQRQNRQVPAGPQFGSPQWRALFRHAVETADRLGLELTLVIQSGWNLGGPGVARADAAKMATWSSTMVRGPAHVEQTLPLPAQRHGLYRDVAVLAYPLRRGAALPGAAGNTRQAIPDLQYKAVFHEYGGSALDSTPLLGDVPEQHGEEDARTADVRDVSSSYRDGIFTWDAPAGEWEILRFGYTASGSEVSTGSTTWKGLAIDPMDRNAFETYFHDVVEPILSDVRPYLGRSLKYLATDSWELDGMNWSARFLEEFAKRRGYSILPYLPVLTGRIVESRAVSDRFLNDFRKTISDLVADNHSTPFAELAARHGLGIHPESGGPHGAPIDALKMLGRSTYPHMEFWARAKTHRTADQERFFVKQGASAAHIYGRGLVAGEGFTNIGLHWEESIWQNLKPTFDRAVCEGLNLLFWHTFTSSPAAAGKPGQEYFAGTHLNPNVTWWDQAGAFLSYINRVQHLMQQGLFVADVLYYYGDNIPAFARLKADDPARVLPGYDYDVTNEEVLLTRLRVRDGLLVLPDGMSYRLLVLPAHGYTSLAALRRIRELVLDGATVAGPRPVRATGLEGVQEPDKEVARLADELWGSAGAGPVDRRVGKGRVIAGRTAREILTQDGIAPDFSYQSTQTGLNLDYVHRRAGEYEIYFLSNQAGQPAEFQATFRVGGKAPEFWFPESGEIRPGGVFDVIAGGRVTVPLRLEPYGSIAVVFHEPAGEHFIRALRDGRDIRGQVRILRSTGGRQELETSESGDFGFVDSAGRTHPVAVNPLPSERVLEGPWTVRFGTGTGAPRVTLDSLTSWTESTDPEVKYFSGTAVYESDIEIPAEMVGPRKGVQLYLGEVREIASVRLNGTSLGIVWNAPFTIEITAAAKPGRNHLEISVTNFWPNQLIGDQQLPEEKRRTSTNITKFTKDSPLLPSGLLGPVRLVPVRQFEIR